MKRGFKVFFSTFLMLFALTITSCGNNSSSSSSEVATVTIVDFDVDEERVDVADVGSEYQVAEVAVEDSAGAFYITTISVSDPTGKAVTVSENNKFIAEKVGLYTITYSVTLSDGQTAAKSYQVEVIDVSEPVVITTLEAHNITMPGGKFDLSTIELEDNSGEEISPQFAVEFNGETLEVNDDILTFDNEGVYTIIVTGSDSSDNEVYEEYNVYTIMDFEHGKYYNNEWYPSEISEKAARNGSHAYDIGLFANAPSWFNDYSMLGDVYLLDAADAKYVSFWIYFDGSGVDMTNIAIDQNARYNEQTVYDIYGQKVEPNWQNKISMENEKWYRFVVSLTEYEMVGDTGDRADAPDNPIVETLRTFAFFAGVWDFDTGSSANKTIKSYLDDVRLIGDVDDEVYDVKPDEPYVYPDYVVADFESSGQVNNFEPSWLSTATINNEITYGESAGSLAFVPHIRWSSLNFKNESLPIDDLTGYEQLSLQVYVSDTSEHNVYDNDVKVGIDIQFGGEGPLDLKKFTVPTAGEWHEIVVPLAAIADQKISEGLKIVLWKTANGLNYGLDQDIEFANSLTLYIDDIIVIPSGGIQTFVPGENVIVSEYESIFAKQLDDFTLDTDYGSFSLYHGDALENNAFINVNDNPYQLAVEAGLTVEGVDTFGESWRIYYGSKGAFGYRFTATEHVFIKVVEQTNENGEPITAGWAEGKLSYGIIKDGVLNIQFDDWFGVGDLSTAYIELQPGETFVYQFSHVDNRNIQNPPTIHVTNAVNEA